MPLPLPDLDTRRWADLVEEGVALVPRHARGWTDHNLHDPGITLIELFAWLVEQDMYRANRITDRARLEFLALVGHAPEPPRPARTVVGAALSAGTGTLDLPAGLVFLASAPGLAALPWTLAGPAALVESRLAALQVHDGARYLDRTPAVDDGTPIAAFGQDPTHAEGDAPGPGLYLGFDAGWPVDRDVSIWIRVEGGDHDQRRRLLQELADREADCARPHCPPGSPGGLWCEPDEADAAGGAANGTADGSGPETGPLPPNRAVGLSWEFLGAGGWTRLEPPTAVHDDTRSLTLDGMVRVRLPEPTVAQAVGAVATPLHWIRCRLERGRWDDAPLLLTVLANPLVLRQELPVTSRLGIAPGVTPAAPPAPGDHVRLDLRFDDAGIVTALDPAPAGSAAPELLIIDYQAAGPAAPGALVVPLQALARGTGLPLQHAEMEEGAPVADANTAVYLATAAGWEVWDRRRVLAASGPLDAHFSLDATAGTVHFGDGVRGRVPEAGARILAAWRVSRGAAGAVPADANWTLAAEPDSVLAAAAGALNRALLGADPAPTAAALASLRNPDPAFGGADEESIGQAAARAAALLWAHERLVELCPADECDTLDQLDRTTVLDLPAPPRAVNALDFERIALDVPGTRVRRARAWPGMDDRYPCLEAPGTVSLVIVPGLPRGRPAPTPALITAIRRWFERRRTLCTRVVVSGPRYRVVHVSAHLQARPTADPARVAADARAALDRFLDPLSGGPAGRGWPFGRDVYRSEVLHLLDGVPGVDHVLRLELGADGAESGCGNICLGPTMLTVSGDHLIDVRPA